MAEKVSLHHADVIMSYRRGNSLEREEALYAVLRHFEHTYTDYQFILLEADAIPTFDWQCCPIKQLQYVFTPDAGAFPKAKLYNLGAKMSGSELLLFNDSDCVANPFFVENCAYDIMHSEEMNAVCPYWEVINVMGNTRKHFIDNHDFHVFNNINKNNLTTDTNLLYKRNTGGVLFFKRKDFIRVGGFNPSYTGWGGEDSDLFYRATRLGLRWSSVQEPLFHLHHEDANRDRWRLQGMVNQDRCRKTETMPIEELKSVASVLREYFIK